MSDRDALVELFLALKGDFWTRKDNWCSDLPNRKWFGVHVNSSGHVEIIDLGRNYLQGSIEFVPWATLTNLRQLSLYDNRIVGNIPREIGRISSLEELDLSWNLLEGSL